MFGRRLHIARRQIQPGCSSRPHATCQLQAWNSVSTVIVRFWGLIFAMEGWGTHHCAFHCLSFPLPKPLSRYMLDLPPCHNTPLDFLPSRRLGGVNPVTLSSNCSLSSDHQSSSFSNSSTPLKVSPRYGSLKYGEPLACHTGQVIVTKSPHWIQASRTDRLFLPGSSGLPCGCVGLNFPTGRQGWSCDYLFLFSTIS
jgi:hypothetical protein